MFESTITYRHTVATAHRLIGHPGKCAHLHGHNYVITTELGNDKLKFSKKQSGQDMVLDFGVVKNVIGKELDDFYDHATLLQEGDPLIEAIRSADPNAKILVSSNRPTAEYMASEIANIIEIALTNAGLQEVFVKSITVQETEGQCAIYRRQ